MSAATGLTRYRIRQQLTMAGVPLRQARFPTDPAWWRWLADSGLTPKQIAAQVGCDVSTVRARLRATKPAPKPAPVSFDEWVAAHSRPDGACRRWIGAHTASGYAMCVHRGRQGVVHRRVWERHDGPIPKGAVVAHRCPHRDCVNLTHLYLTDPAGRVADTKARGRVPQGEDRSNAVLTWDAVQLIRTGNKSTRDLAARFGVSTSTIQDARSRRSWRNPPATGPTVR